MAKLFKKIRLLDLFDNQYKRGTRLVKSNRIQGKYPLITAGIENHGISDYIKWNTQLFLPNSLTIDMFGNVFYRNYSFFADDNILILHNNNYNSEIMQFIGASIHKATLHQYSYGKQFHGQALQKLNIELPVTSTGELDTEYMINYIHQIEADYIHQIEQYLMILGYKSLSDCQLTDEDKRILQGPENTKKVKIGELFDKKTVRGFSKSVAVQRSNNGYHVFGQNISYQYKYKVILPKQYLFTVSSPILAYASSTGQVGLINESFYRTGNNGAFQALLPHHFSSLNNQTPSLKSMLYLLACVNKRFSIFNYGTSVNNVLLLNLTLPSTSDNQIDFDFMDKYITAIEKKKVLNLKAFIDEKLQLYQKLIN